MLQFISNTSIFRRLFIAFAIAAIIPGIIIVLLGSYYINSLSIRGQAVRTSFDAQNIASQEQTNLQGMNALLQARNAQVFATMSGIVQDSSLNAAGTSIYLDLLTRRANFEQTLKTYQSDYELATSSNMSNIRSMLLSDDPNNSQIISTQQAALNKIINQQWPQYSRLQDQELTQLQYIEDLLQKHTVFTPQQINQAYTQSYTTLFQANAVFTDLRNSWQSVVDSAVSMGKTVTAVGPSQTQPVWIATSIAFMSVILVVLATGYVVNLTITRPLRQLASLTRRITQGDTSARADIVGHDEIHLVATSMNSMLDNIVRLIQSAQTQRDNLQAQVEKLVSEVSGVGEGDLRIQAEVTTDALGVLADSFNYMVEELSSLIVRVKMVAHEVENSTAMTFEHMAQLVKTADMKINAIAEAAVEVERMTHSSRKVAERAQILFNVAREARQTAQSGREAVQQTVDGMGRIQDNVQDTANKIQLLGERSREINNIVEVMTTIAHQTNRLALDAAIQAAMAGENGKGFGAVAADIRRLAEQAKDQAGMIARIVRSFRDDIGAVAVSIRDTERETSAGTSLAQEAGTSLESIFAVVERQAQEIEDINAMTTQQLQSSSAVVQIMRNVSNSTERSSTITREASKNMERLARFAEQLLASVEAFKLRENGNYYAPASNTRITLEEEQNKQLNLSSAFRTITATAQSSNPGMYNGTPRLMPPVAQPANAAQGFNRSNGSNGSPSLRSPRSVASNRQQPYQQPDQQPSSAASNWQQSDQQNRISRIPLRPVPPE